MCDRVFVRVWQEANNVQELKNLIGDDIVIDVIYRNQDIKPDQCLCCVDLEAIAKQKGWDLEKIGDAYYLGVII